MAKVACICRLPQPQPQIPNPKNKAATIYYFFAPPAPPLVFFCRVFSCFVTRGVRSSKIKNKSIWLITKNRGGVFSEKFSLGCRLFGRFFYRVFGRFVFRHKRSSKTRPKKRGNFSAAAIKAATATATYLRHFPLPTAPLALALLLLLLLLGAPCPCSCSCSCSPSAERPGLQIRKWDPRSCAWPHAALAFMAALWSLLLYVYCLLPGLCI
jgi:hypothetical protein